MPSPIVKLEDLCHRLLQRFNKREPPGGRFVYLEHFLYCLLDKAPLRLVKIPHQHFIQCKPSQALLKANLVGEKTRAVQLRANEIQPVIEILSAIPMATNLFRNLTIERDPVSSKLFISNDNVFHGVPLM